MSKVHEIAEIMEWMKDSPMIAVINYLKTRAEYSWDEIQQAFKLFMQGRS